ncbi:hypothetical protein SAMN04488589_2411 [Methanolobus vulcani]|uniref:Antitoxin SocA-like Panacea domain-containing protein n=1 Tax=Methanolobus vulcani TaxID=38026 RepID=A0A7Z7B0W1_9EURY|nr:hypothetical protein [Methanolobus vulcani]SDG20699.1 hypothetical protein SAMN04488589_2411 [Methanolobus vulcani]
MANEKILSKVLDIIGLGKPDMSDFDNRLQYQKVIYLLQASGLSLGYGYNWYLKGPYSSPLAHTLFAIDDNTFESSKGLVFKNNEVIEEKLEAFKKKLGEDIKDVNYLEILASLHYINKANFAGNGKGKELTEKLFQVKPYLKEADPILIEKALNNLKDYN